MNYKLKFLLRINALTIISLCFFLLQFALILNEVRWRVASETKKKNESNQLRVSVSGARASNTGPSALICPVDKSANKQKKLSLSLSLRRVSVSFTIGKKIEEKQGIDGGKKERRNQQ